MTSANTNILTPAAIADEFVGQMNDDTIRLYSRDDDRFGIDDMLSTDPESASLDLDEVLDAMEILIGARLWELLTAEAREAGLTVTEDEIVLAQNAGGGTIDAIRYDETDGEVWLAENGDTIPWAKIAPYGDRALSIQDILDAR